MGVPSKCTIIRVMGRSAYRLKAKTHKRNNCILSPQGNFCLKVRISSVNSVNARKPPVKHP